MKGLWISSKFGSFSVESRPSRDIKNKKINIPKMIRVPNMQYLRYFDRVPLARNGAPNVILKQTKNLNILFATAKTLF